MVVFNWVWDAKEHKAKSSISGFFWELEEAIERAVVRVEHAVTCEVDQLVHVFGEEVRGEVDDELQKRRKDFDLLKAEREENRQLRVAEREEKWQLRVAEREKRAEKRQLRVLLEAYRTRLYSCAASRREAADFADLKDVDYCPSYLCELSNSKAGCVEQSTPSASSSSTRAMSDFLSPSAASTSSEEPSMFMDADVGTLESQLPSPPAGLPDPSVPYLGDLCNYTNDTAVAEADMTCAASREEASEDSFPTVKRSTEYHFLSVLSDIEDVDDGMCDEDYFPMEKKSTEYFP